MTACGVQAGAAFDLYLRPALLSNVFGFYALVIFGLAFLVLANYIAIV